MTEETKKISFGFSKFKKTSNLVKPVIIEKEVVELVDAFDGRKGKFSYKGSLREEKKTAPLVIPLVGTRTAYDVIKAKLEENDNKTTNNEEVIQIKQEPVENVSIEALAAREILSDLQETKTNDPVSNMVIPKTEDVKPSFKGETESTLEDYDNVPVADYGLAMLRGMGWKPEKGIGKNERVVSTITTKLRPKGLGLGADKAMAQAAAPNTDLVLGKNSYVKILVGQHRGVYGQVSSVDGDTGRVIVKLVRGETISLPELSVVAVTKKDFDTNSRVINAVKYEQYKEQEASLKESTNRKLESSSEDRSRRKKHGDDEDSLGEEKPSRKQKHRGDDSLSDEERSRRRKKHRDSSDEEHSGRGKKKYKDEDVSSEDRYSGRRKKQRGDSSPSDAECDKKSKKKKKKDTSSSHSRDKKHKNKKKKSSKYSSDSSDSEMRRKKQKHKKERYSKSSKSSR